jgi:hypothetical protein
MKRIFVFDMLDYAMYGSKLLAVLPIVRFQVVSAKFMKMAFICVVVPFILIAASIIRAMIVFMMEAANTSETSANFYRITRSTNLDDSLLHISFY